ncbi:transcriptional regulator [Herbidospora sp. NEAU-GS84]|uniref:Transcriptional regulator n=1 Tax=Herbidospora solisilvae TaxID=2696284 RepID=A0A7C9JAN4_9ACTN|nr:transcriptional regulator [Herbidospora solisilvae]NAS24928.1 transcriptional regulator [Herbidospora solisilvae]
MPIDDVLSELAESRATGALKAGRSGTVYLSRGRVCYVECARTPTVEELLTASGRLTLSGMRTARQTAAATADGGDLLVRRGVLSRGELQLCVLGATLDASFFLFGANVPKPKFREGDRHWLGIHWFFDVPGLFRECHRRRARLDRAWPSAELDSRPVVPVRRIRSQHVVLTALQWEILLNADAETTPAELAKRIGRPAYTTLLAVREMAAAGLLECPEPPPPEKPPDLPKRVAGSAPRAAAGAGGRARSSYPEISGDPTDVNLLIRLRNALEAFQ